jgi:hypothetical protein
MSTVADAGSSRVIASATGLRVFVACDPWLFALQAELVERLLLPDQALLDEEHFLDKNPSLGMLRVGGSAYPAWDLGLLLGLSRQSDAWVLLRLPSTPEPLPLALRTGPCLSAALLPETALRPLPAALSRERPGLVTGAFSTARLRLVGRRVGPVGLGLDVTRLWSDRERARSAALRATVGGEEP